MLALRTRLAIAEARYDDALDGLRMNYRMARDVAKEPLLVCGLVGMAEADQSNSLLIELAAAERAPSLYWSLAELPRPFISLRDAVRFEMSIGLRVFPFLLDAETAEHSPAEWSRLLAQGWRQMSEFDGGRFMQSPLGTALATSLSMVVMYPQAKARLVNAGMDPGRVEGMPVGQVVAIDAAREYRRIADELEKLWYMPYRESLAFRDEVEKQILGQPPVVSYGQFLAGGLLPAISAARDAEVRLERQFAALQVVEALRLHAGDTGALPASLDEVTVVPLPTNPASGKPFEYHLAGSTAVLDLPFRDGVRGQAWRIEIKLNDDD